MLIVKKSPEWQAQRNDCRAAWHAALTAGRAGNTALQATKIHEYQTLCERLGIPIDTTLAVESRAGPVSRPMPAHAGESRADIFARRRAQASAASQETVHARELGRSARAAGAAEPVDSASVYARRRQAGERTRIADSGAAEG